MNSKITLSVLSMCLFLFNNCSKKDNLKTVSFQLSSAKSINIENQITDIPLELYFSFGSFHIFDTLLFIFEANPKNEKVIHVLSTNSLKYLTSTGNKGRGPGELTPMAGSLMIDTFSKTIMINDLGKYVIYKSPVDSILNNKDFIPVQKINMNRDVFLDRGFFINDSILLGTVVIPLSPSIAKKRTVRYNINSQTFVFIGHDRDDIEGNDSHGGFSLSIKHDKYVRTYPKFGFIDICDFKGNHLLTIKDEDVKGLHYRALDNAQFYKDYIISSYTGEYSSVVKEKVLGVSAPDKLIVFNMNGSHFKTLELGNKFSSWIVDEENQRLIIYFNDREHLLGYIDLSELLP